jgi:hypothetical protein
MEFFKGAKDNPAAEDYNAPQNGYLVRKKTSPLTTFSPTEYYIYRPDILYRLGEAYLNYAEALNESSPGHADILKYLNEIRERAGIPTYGSNPGQIPAPPDQTTMREAIRAERYVELCCEGTRYDDLRRWKKAEELLTGKFDGMNFNGATEATYYKRTVYQTRQYKKQFYWFPISQGQMDKNSNLIQTPFWAQAN